MLVCLSMQAFKTSFTDLNNLTNYITTFLYDWFHLQCMLILFWLKCTTLSRTLQFDGDVAYFLGICHCQQNLRFLLCWILQMPEVWITFLFVVSWEFNVVCTLKFCMFSYHNNNLCIAKNIVSRFNAYINLDISPC